MYTLSKGLKTYLTDRRGKTEDKVEDYLVEQVTAIGGHALKIRLITGFPDRLILLPGAVVDFIECKRPKGGKFEPLQPLWIKRLRKLGFTVLVIKNKQEVDDYIKRKHGAL
jgi:hypothetical protein